MELDPEKKQPHLVATEEETQAEDLFVVDGLDADAVAESELFSLMSMGSPEAGSPLDLNNDSAAVAELAQAPSLEEEVDFNAAVGEVAAVEPPVSSEVAPVEGSDVEVMEPELAAAPRFALRPWMAGAIAATVIASVGIVAKLMFAPAPVPVDMGPVAEAPAPSPVLPMPIDMACAPRIAATTEAPAILGAPAVAELTDWAVANPVPEGELPVNPTTEVAPVNSDPKPVTEPPQPGPSNGGELLASIPMIGNPNPAPDAAKAGFGRGGEVFVKLKNGNLFTGRLEKLTTSDAKIRVAKGEIEFLMSELDVIIPVAQAPADRGPEAILYLLNGNRLAGRLSSDANGKVLLAVGASEVVISRSEIQKIDMRPPLGLILDTETLKNRKEK